MYVEKDGQVVLTMDRDDYDRLLLVLGYCTGAAANGDGPVTFIGMVRLINRLNEGNPGFTPYEVPSVEARQA